MPSHQMTPKIYRVPIRTQSVYSAILIGFYSQDGRKLDQAIRTTFRCLSQRILDTSPDGLIDILALVDILCHENMP